jgi:16S rRNA (cytosine967-C5)-methyltransferase
MAQLSPGRDVAFRILMRVETRQAFADELLNSHLTARLSGADRRLAQELVMGCLRWQGQLDFLAAHYGAKPPLDAEVRVALRAGIYQMRFLDRVPPRAAVDQSVEWIKGGPRRAAAGLVNAVLRKVNREPVAMPDEARYSTPAWLLKRWGPEIAAVYNERPVSFVRLPPGHVSALPPGRYVRRCAIALEETPWPVQDEASQMIAYLLDARPGAWVLDLCAAPGNKTAGIAELAPEARIVAGDLHPRRLARVTAPMRLALDGSKPLPFRRRFDRVLVDAPCSGTGTVRRNPEIKWRLKLEDLADLASRQAALLENALAWLEPGGRLVYATCSLEPEENEQVVEGVLARAPGIRLCPASAERDRLAADFTAEGLALLGDPWFRAQPSPHGSDGFFAAILEKRS